jgi:hypothetical protein
MLSERMPCYVLKDPIGPTGVHIACWLLMNTVTTWPDANVSPENELL